jgi:hypothetical protein
MIDALKGTALYQMVGRTKKVKTGVSPGRLRVPSYSNLTFQNNDMIVTSASANYGPLFHELASPLELFPLPAPLKRNQNRLNCQTLVRPFCRVFSDPIFRVTNDRRIPYFMSATVACCFVAASCSQERKS